MDFNDGLRSLFSNFDLEDIDEYNKAKSLVVALFACKNVNKIPYKTFSTIKNIIKDVFETDEESAENVSIAISQALSISNQLITNINDVEITTEHLSKFTEDNSKITFDYITNDLIKDYKLHWIINTKKEKFLKSIGEITNNQEVLSAAASFIHYHCVNNISDDEAIQRDCALANLIRLCTINSTYKELKTLIKEQFDIDDNALNAFITSHIDLIFGA